MYIVNQLGYVQVRLFDNSIYFVPSVPTRQRSLAIQTLLFLN